MLVERGRGPLLQFADQLLVFAGARFSKASYQLGRGQIVDGLHLDDGCLAGIFANRRGQPLKPFLIVGLFGSKYPEFPSGTAP